MRCCGADGQHAYKGAPNTPTVSLLLRRLVQTVCHRAPSHVCRLRPAARWVASMRGYAFGESGIQSEP
jgi:hypothetical protein